MLNESCKLVISYGAWDSEWVLMKEIAAAVAHPDERPAEMPTQSLSLFALHQMGSRSSKSEAESTGDSAVE